MPTAIKRACLYPGCINHAVKNGKCDVHKQQDRSNEAEDRHRFYKQKQWRKFAKTYLIEHPLCVLCAGLTAATQVDHIVPRSEGGDDWDEANLQALCQSCHSRKTMREWQRRGAR